MILILCGKSGCGKDSIMKKLIRFGFNPLISYTTRPKRDGEQDGKEYHFVSDSDFQSMIEKDELIEYRTYDTIFGKWYYGLKKTKINQHKNYIVILDLEGANSLKYYYGKENCFVCFIDVYDSIRTERAKKRGSFNEDEWNRRMETDNKDFSRNNVLFNSDCCVENNYSLSTCLSDILTNFIHRNFNQI